MHIKEAIVLAGGLGTRLRSAVPGLPKCMAPVNGRPFISFVVDYFRKKGIERFVFSLGYKSESITDYIARAYPEMKYTTVVETTPLGTGGAIRLACTKASGKNVLVLNGDTLFKVAPGLLASFHVTAGAHCTLALKPMQHFSRYGVVELNADHAIQSFKEKQYYEQGLINGGVYALDAERFLKESLPEKFSFEKDYLEAYFDKRRIFGLVQDAYFIDIGIPEDYNRAQEELAREGES